MQTLRRTGICRDLASLFSTTPEQLRAKIKGKGAAKGLAVAGTQPSHDLDLDRMQVRQFICRLCDSINTKMMYRF
jgi:hypothetical protein